jgi:hypothetical protein
MSLHLPRKWQSSDLSTSPCWQCSTCEQRDQTHWMVQEVHQDIFPHQGLGWITLYSWRPSNIQLWYSCYHLESNSLHSQFHNTLWYAKQCPCLHPTCHKLSTHSLTHDQSPRRTCQIKKKICSQFLVSSGNQCWDLCHADQTRHPTCYEYSSTIWIESWQTAPWCIQVYTSLPQWHSTFWAYTWWKERWCRPH